MIARKRWCRGNLCEVLLPQYQIVGACTKADNSKQILFMQSAEEARSREYNILISIYDIEFKPPKH